MREDTAQDEGLDSRVTFVAQILCSGVTPRTLRMQWQCVEKAGDRSAEKKPARQGAPPPGTYRCFCASTVRHGRRLRRHVFDLERGCWLDGGGVVYNQ